MPPRVKRYNVQPGSVTSQRCFLSTRRSLSLLLSPFQKKTYQLTLTSSLELFFPPIFISLSLLILLPSAHSLPHSYHVTTNGETTRKSKIDLQETAFSFIPSFSSSFFVLFNSFEDDTKTLLRTIQRRTGDKKRKNQRRIRIDIFWEFLLSCELCNCKEVINCVLWWLLNGVHVMITRNWVL